MEDRLYLTELERDFLAARKEYLDQVEITTRLVEKNGDWEADALQSQCDQEETAFDRYSKARSIFLQAYAEAAAGTLRKAA